MATFGPFCTSSGTKTGENRKKPVETKESPLTFNRKTLNVNCGTILGAA
jgi:hypothetical protein